MGFWKEFFAAPMKAEYTKSNGISAEVIHAEVDEAEEKFLNKVKEILSQKEATATKVVVEDHVKNKANMLKELGFSNNSLITDVKKRETLKESLQKEAKLLEETIDLFQKYKAHYPTEKIMPFEDFHKVLVKYNLIYAPASTYIRDVPEKNLLEIKNSKPTLEEDKCPPIWYLSEITCNNPWSSDGDITDKQKKAFLTEIKNKKLNICDVKFSKRYRYKIYLYKDLEDYWPEDKEGDFDFDHSFNNLLIVLKRQNPEALCLPKGYSRNNNYIIDIKQALVFIKENPSIVVDKYKGYLITLLSNGYKGVSSISTSYKIVDSYDGDLERLKTQISSIVKDSIKSNSYRITPEFRTIDRTQLLIAAPKSHFDMSSLTKVEDRGYYTQNIEEIKVNVITKDPIAFELLAGNEQYPDGFVRIKSKWGTADDQSYLDPALTNENMN